MATIIDTRAPNECRVRPIRVRGAVDYRNVPLLDDVALARVARRFDVEGENYLWQLEHHVRRVGTILTVIADAAPGGVLVHCAAGKDRTGLIASLVLAIAGVDRKVIASDYAALSVGRSSACAEPASECSPAFAWPFRRERCADCQERSAEAQTIRALIRSWTSSRTPARRRYRSTSPRRLSSSAKRLEIASGGDWYMRRTRSQREGSGSAA